jgi:hypothetical protein
MVITMNDSFIDFILEPFFVVACFALLIIWFIVSSDKDQKIIECEKSLPRDQHCVLVAIPENQLRVLGFLVEQRLLPHDSNP